MPIYEYQCKKGHVTTAYATVESRAAPQSCRCGLQAEKVILSPPKVFGDLQAYQSPVTGRWVEGKRQREQDLRDSRCRPYEEGEREEAVRRAAANERQLDHDIDVAVEQTVADILR